MGERRNNPTPSIKEVNWIIRAVMKRIMVISDGRNTGQALIQQLKGLFGNEVSAENLLLKELPGKSFDSDLVIYTSGYVK